MATKKNPIIGPATRAKITSAVRKVQNSKAAGTAKKAGTAIKQEARVIGRAATGYGAKKKKESASISSPAAAFQATSKTFGSGKVKSPSEMRKEKRQERAENREFNRSGRSADRTKRVTDATRSFTTSPGSERFQSSKEGLTFKGIPLSDRKRKAVRTISENLNTKLEGRERKKLAKEYYKNIKSKPKTMEEMRKQNKKKSKQASKCIPGGKGNNLCSPQGRNNDGGF